MYIEILIRQGFKPKKNWKKQPIDWIAVSPTMGRLTNNKFLERFQILIYSSNSGKQIHTDSMWVEKIRTHWGPRVLGHFNTVTCLFLSTPFFCSPCPDGRQLFQHEWEYVLWGESFLDGIWVAHLRVPKIGKKCRFDTFVGRFVAFRN